MRRREFLGVLGGAAAWPLSARAQPGDKRRRIGMFITVAPDDPEMHARLAAFLKKLQELGWSEDRNIRIDYRWSAAGAGDTNRMRNLARELVQLDPDVIVSQSTPAIAALRDETAVIPVVFVQVTDPVGAGFVASLAHPGKNITGFAMYEPDMGAKWLEVLKEIAPAVVRVAILFNPNTAPGRGLFFLRSFEAAAPSFRVQAVPTAIRDADTIERAIDGLARESNSGLFVMPDQTTELHRALIVSLAARHRLPAVYSQRFFVAGGGLISYGIDTINLFRQGASYVDRILRGEKPSQLPVQGPVTFEMAINLKAAKALGITVPPTLLARADEVIE